MRGSTRTNGGARHRGESRRAVAVGAQAAAGIVALRANDGSFPDPPPPPFTGGTNPGEWRPTISYLAGPPPSLSPMAAEWFAKVRPFTLISPSQFRVGPPPDLTRRRYLRAYNEVKALGSLSSTERTAAQTDLGYFFSGNFLVLWNRALRDIAEAYLTRIGDTARLFALANMAIADAVITTWDSKRHYVFWRPVTAVQEGDNDGNPRTAGDTAWQPLINTPPYPDYTSGANDVTGAVTTILKLFFGTDHLTFTLNATSPQAVQQTRTYARSSDAARDVVDVRVHQGIHFRFADILGRRQGTLVARWAFKNFLRPVACDDEHDDDDDQDDDD